MRGRGRGEGLTEANVVLVVVSSDGSLSLFTVHIVEEPQLCPHLLCYHLPILYTQEERAINEREHYYCTRILTAGFC